MLAGHKNPELVVGRKYKLIATKDGSSKHLIGEEFTVTKENLSGGFDTDLYFRDGTVWWVESFMDNYTLVEEKKITPIDRRDTSIDDRWDILNSEKIEICRDKNTPILLDSENVVAFDCDDTLVMWDAKVNNVYVTCPYTNRQECLARHEVHIQELKKNKAKGNTTVVWSAGGVKWAEAVVKALQIEEYVDLIMAKPQKFFDDLPANEVLVNRVYIPFKEKE